MKATKIVGLISGMLLVPTLVAAQPDVPPPDVPPPPPQTPQVPQTPQTPQTPQPAAPVVVYPAQPATTTTTVVREPRVLATDPEGYMVADEWNAPVFASGALMFAGSYGASAIVAATSDHPGADRLYVPVVGPWLALNDWGHCPIGDSRCDSNTTDKVLLIGDGIFQAASVITMIDGLLAPSYHRAMIRTVDRKVHVRPISNGVAVSGVF